MSTLTLLEAGSFRHRLTLEEAVETSDGMGGVVRSWVELRSVWAHLEPVRSDMRERASQTDELVTHRIYTRQGGVLSSELRLRRGDRIFDIEHFHDPDETGRYWLISVVEKGR